MNRDELRDALDGGSLRRVRNEILELATSCLRIGTEAVPTDSLDVGESRIGGVPDVPAGFEWPSWNGQPQSFIAQLRLEDLLEIPLPLPSEGSLLFFYSSEQDTWGFDPKDGPSFGVHHVPPGQQLRRTDVPSGLPDLGAFSSCRLGVHVEVSLPPWESRHVERLGLDDAEADEYFDLLERSIGGDYHQIGGYPDQVQGDMTMELPLVTAGLYTGDASGWKDPRAEELQEGWESWKLLLQVGSDPSARMMWGDAGYLYYWIEEDALTSGSFERAWMILQCS